MYLAMKLVHVLATVVFLGNIITAVFWKRWADATGDPRIMARTCAGLVRADRIFTIPAVIVLLIAGFGAAGIAKYPILHTRWILWSLILLVLSAHFYMSQVFRAQKQMAALARRGAEQGGLDRERYAALTRSWNVWGTVALITPLLAAALMVLKP